jgi:hypothetical protein
VKHLYNKNKTLKKEIEDNTRSQAQVAHESSYSGGRVQEDSNSKSFERTYLKMYNTKKDW